MTIKPGEVYAEFEVIAIYNSQDGKMLQMKFLGPVRADGSHILKVIKYYPEDTDAEILALAGLDGGSHV